MDIQLLEFTRRQMERNFSRAMQRTYNSFWHECRLLSAWISTHPLLGASVRVLSPKAESYRASMVEVSEKYANQRYSLTEKDYIVTKSYEDQAAVAWAALELVKETIGEPHTGKFQALCRMMIDQAPRESGAVVDSFRDFVLPNIKDYLNHYLDGRDITLLLLEKYKKKCEWFWRSRLREQAHVDFEGAQKGERSLCIHLYDYLHDQGLEFDIEPLSPGGRVDALAEHWAIDAKYLPPKCYPSEITAKISSGFGQVADYCGRHNRAMGYLVVYKEKDVLIQPELDAIDGSRYLLLGGKVIHYCEVDIAEYEDSASHRGTAQVHAIPREHLIKSV